MTQPASVGTLSRCSISQTSTFATALEYKDFGLKLHQEIVSTDGIRGTHMHPAERTRLGRIACAGPITFQPGKSDLDLLLPLITGTTKNGSDAFLNVSGLLSESLLPFLCVVDRIAKVYTYAGSSSTTAGCYVASAAFHIAEGEPMSLTLQVEGIQEYIGAAGTFPATTFNYQPPYMWSDFVLTIGGTVYQFRELTLTWTNHLKTDRYMNSIIRTDIPFLDRIVTFDVRLPNTSDQAALLAYPAQSATPVVSESFSLVGTQGSDSISFASSAFGIEPESPDLPGREETLLPIHGRLYAATGLTVPECTITNVST